MTKWLSIALLSIFVLLTSLGHASANDRGLRQAAVRSLTNATGLKLSNRHIVRRGNYFETRRRGPDGQPLGRVPVIRQGSGRTSALGRAESNRRIFGTENLAPLDHRLVSQRPLRGRKVVILVESQFVPQELHVYRERFEAYGAEVIFATNLWGTESLQFHSHYDQNVIPEVTWMDVDRDVREFDLSSGEVAAVIQSVHVQQRLLYHQDIARSDDPIAATQQAPGVQLIERALRNPNVVVGAHGHGVEVLAPLGHLIRGARVTGSPGSLVHVVNAGARYVPPAEGAEHARHVVTEDRVPGLNLVTGTSVTNGGTEAFVDAVTRRVQSVQRSLAQRWFIDRQAQSPR